MRRADGLGPQDTAIHEFWERARPHVEGGHLPVVLGQSITEAVPPPSFSFADDALLDLVLSGRKTASASVFVLSDDDSIPSRGDLDIVLDSAGTPRALLVTTAATVVRFCDVDAEHAVAEGEGDLSLDHWRREHERLFTEEGSFDPQMDVLLERFEVLYQE